MKAKIMGKCAKQGSFQVSSQLQNITTIFFSYVCYALNLVHKLICETHLTLLPT